MQHPFRRDRLAPLAATEHLRSSLPHTLHGLHTALTPVTGFLSARPILLTAAAASLALIPISRQIFWGPMAYAMMGGIIAGTVITLVFAPALYVAVFRVRPGK